MSPRWANSVRQSVYAQVLHRYNEAIALDYVIPFRVVGSPASDEGMKAYGEMVRKAAAAKRVPRE